MTQCSTVINREGYRMYLTSTSTALIWQSGPGAIPKIAEMLTTIYAAGRRKAGLLRNRAAAAAAATAAALPGAITGATALDAAVPLGEMPLAAPFMGAPASLPPLKSGRGGRANGKGYGARAMRGGKAAASVDTTSNITPGKEVPPAGVLLHWLVPWLAV